MYKYVSMSLFGNDPKYTVGALRNASLMQKFYPGWKMIVYHDMKVPRDVLEQLRDLQVKLVDNNLIEGTNKTMWRFLVNDLVDCERYVVRDCDSRFNEREKWAVETWEKSGHPFHIMRDHPNHKDFKIPGGMWGSKRGFIENMAFLISKYPKNDTAYGHDQNFLKHCIWPKASTTALIHDSALDEIGNVRHFPMRKNHRFVGEVFDQNDVPRDGEWQMLTDAPKVEDEPIVVPVSTTAKPQPEPIIQPEVVVAKPQAVKPTPVKIKTVKREPAQQKVSVNK